MNFYVFNSKLSLFAELSSPRFIIYVLAEIAEALYIVAYQLYHQKLFLK